MSNPENFIDEVTEEVRRDKLFALMRKYGWIGVTGVLLLVGGAAYNEWSKAQAQAKAEAVGDAILAAEELEDRAARAKMLQGVPAEGDAKAVLSLLAADAEEGGTSLERLAQDASLSKVYRDLAALKLVMQAGTDMEPQQVAEHLEPLLVAGAPFRVMAEEQMALVELAQGQKDAAISRLQALLSDEEASQALRQRASQLIVALGGVPEAS
ncbi:hypothetical protein SAMN04488527_1186 [Aliiroseovarius crassostreae]|uniref:Tetratricopeptide repeat-like domain-containing protein n=1 Tax=Aliiroseovarius crassostreae TaxID=154981 RepID=A0A0P7KF05_9RHOB|nr:hypothetical protein [Aliiroseovarius crassostreae]KPN62020.1 hypothetical protein AKJ29_05310 [Aliiroseovarius crassostreae]SFU80622.1 hypothetical protein SAMN04488527_1186 [Aliiroseovarius crassostreae]